VCVCMCACVCERECVFVCVCVCACVCVCVCVSLWGTSVHDTIYHGNTLHANLSLLFKFKNQLLSNSDVGGGKREGTYLTRGMVYIYLHTHTHIYIYIHICAYICRYIYTYIYVDT